MKAILYPRVSTDEQRESGLSLPSQLDACRAYAQAHEFEIVAELPEDFTGTVPLEARPAGSQAYAMLKSGEADALIVYRIDRLVRPPEEGDEWEFPILIRSLAKLGKEIHTCNRGKIGTNFADLLLAMLESKTAGEELRSIIERTTRGRRMKAKSGRVVGAGSTLFGYTYTDGQYIVNEKEAKTVRLIFELYVNKRMSLWQVASYLNSRHITTRAGFKWNEASIHRRIAEPAYAGQWDYAAITVEIPAIISREMFEAATRVRGDNRNYASRNAQRLYLLRGMIRCECGCRGRFYGIRFTNKSGVSYYYYSSLYSHGREARSAQRECHEKNIRANVVERLAWEYAREVIMQDDDLLRAALEKLIGVTRSASDEYAQRMAQCDTDIAEAEAEAERLAGQLDVGGIVAEKIRAKIEKVNVRHADLLKLRAELERAAPKPLTAHQVIAIVELKRELAALMADPAPEKKRIVFELMRLTCKVKDGRGVFGSIFPFVSGPQDLHPDPSSRQY